ncbi:MAG: helix-hairpin-helix domain-containing protein [Bacillota bacterium]|nr:helix-hairpin-helix domain-containing protein [Bacillota bacterium]
MLDWLREKGGINEKVIIGLLVLLLISGGIWRGAQQNLNSSSLTQVGAGDITEHAEPEPELITVHLVGAVMNPGVYHLQEGARVYELLELAGGFNDDAEQETLNQARPLIDGEQIYILKAGELPGQEMGSFGSNSKKVNINKAGAAELATLPGIGEVRANQIIAHREKHGYFTQIRELMDVSGIGEKTFENLEELITIY